MLDVSKRFVISSVMLLLVLAGKPVAAQQSPFFHGDVAPEKFDNKMPKILSDVGLDQRLNAQVSWNLPFVDESGRTVTLGSYGGTKPVLVALIYFQCPMLCSQTLNGMFGALKAVSFDPGKDFNVVVVSFNPLDTPALAAAKKHSYLSGYHMLDHNDGFHFLTGSPASIRALTKEVGFRYVYDSLSKQYAHVSGLILLTPQGRVSRYFYGLEYSPKDLKFGIMDASNNQIGSPVEQLLLYCYHYDPTTGKYGASAVAIMKIGGALTILAVVGMWILLQKQAKKRAALRIQALLADQRVLEQIN